MPGSSSAPQPAPRPAPGDRRPAFSSLGFPFLGLARKRGPRYAASATAALIQRGGSEFTHAAPWAGASFLSADEHCPLGECDAFCLAHPQLTDMAPWAPCEWSAGRPHTGVRAVTLTPAPACGWGPCQRPPRICPAREGTRKANTVHGIFHPNTRLISVTARLEVSDERQRRLYSTRRQWIVVPAMTSRRKAEDAEVMFWVLSGFTSASARAQPASFSMVGDRMLPPPQH